jgi:glutamyl-tRNA reductase
VSLLVVGVSHHTAPVELLESIVIPAGATTDVLSTLVAQPHVSEAVVLSTCNRVEVYASVTAFHGGLTEVGSVLAGRAGLDVAELAAHLYVHFDNDAVHHVLRVAAGLDSMVVGEAQILGQLRDAYGLAATQDTVGRLLHELMQQALRVGKRVHAETDIDRAGQSVVTAALGLAPQPVGGQKVLVVGAGSMGGLALATLARAGAAPLLVANRNPQRAQRLAELHGATAVDFADLSGPLGTADMVVCATASPEAVLTAEAVSAAMRSRAGRPLTIVDLAVPHDVQPEVGDLPGVTLIDIASVGKADLDRPSTHDQQAAESIVASEVATFLSWLRGSEVGPTVAALRARADEVVASELRRLNHRRADLTDDQRADIAHTVHRIVQRLLHSPTVRVRQLAGTPGGDQYAAALRELFDLSVVPPDEELDRAVAVAWEAVAGEAVAGEEVDES